MDESHAGRRPGAHGAREKVPASLHAHLAMRHVTVLVCVILTVI